MVFGALQVAEGSDSVVLNVLAAEVKLQWAIRGDCGGNRGHVEEVIIAVNHDTR